MFENFYTWLTVVEYLSQMTRICSTYRKHFLILSSFMTYHRIFNQINTTDVTSGAGTAGAPEFTPGFQWSSCYSIVSFMCMSCRSLFVLLYFFFWPLCCLSFFDLRILITPLGSSNSFYNKTMMKNVKMATSTKLILFNIIQ